MAPVFEFDIKPRGSQPRVEAEAAAAAKAGTPYFESAAPVHVYFGLFTNQVTSGPDGKPLWIKRRAYVFEFSHLPCRPSGPAGPPGDATAIEVWN